MTNFFDSLVNLVAGLGGPRDKTAHSVYGFNALTDLDLGNAYRGAWLPRKIIDIPPRDETRNWRNWQGSSDEIQRMEAEEKRLGLQGKVKEARSQARLWGGAAIVIGSRDTDLSKPLEPSRFSPQRPITYLVVMNRLQLTAGEIEQDPTQPLFGRPKWYIPQGARTAVQIHPSRVVRFIGNAPAGDTYNNAQSQGWGDSVLNSVWQALQQTDSTVANVASLVFEAKVDVFKIPDFMRQMDQPRFRELVLQRLSLAAIAKGINGTLLMDAQEEYESKSANFGSLDAIMDRMFQVASGAADIPLTRLFGTPPKGLGNAGESDMANYYDTVRSSQELEITPELATLDTCMMYSAIGKVPPTLHYEWASLWQTTPKEQADIGKVTADTIKTLSDTKLWPADALSKAGANALVEVQALPGLEDALGEATGSDEPEPDAPGDTTPARVTDAAPQPLYVSRKVENAAQVLAHFKAQGLETIEAGELHVTIAYSRTPVDWMKIGSYWAAESDGKLTVAAGGPRIMEKFGEATVLLFNSWHLSGRHADIREAGASWDHADYQPHVTIAYNTDADISAIKPYTGPILLGPEIFEALDTNWSEDKK